MSGNPLPDRSCARRGVLVPGYHGYAPLADASSAGELLALDRYATNRSCRVCACPVSYHDSRSALAGLPQADGPRRSGGGAAKDANADVACRPGAPVEVRGARNWAKGAIAYAQAARFMRPALINGAVGLILAPRGRLQRVLAFEFDVEGRIRAAEIISDPARLGTLDLAALP